MKLLEILDIKETPTESDEDLLKKIKQSYKKLSFKYHPDRTNGNKESTERLLMITEIYKVLENTDYRKYYIDHHNQLDLHFKEKEYSKFIETYIKNAILDTDKVNQRTAQAAYIEFLPYFSATGSGLDNIQLAIDAVNNPLANDFFAQPIHHLSEEAKKYYLHFLEGKKEEIVSIIKKAQEVFSKQNIQHNQQSLIRLSDLISQLQRNDSSNIPPELFNGVDDDKRWQYISAYSDVLNINKNWIKKAHDVVSQHNFRCNWQSLAALHKLITEINQGNYAEIHPELLRNVHENEKAPLVGAYLERLNHYKNVYQKAQEVISQQNFQYDQQNLRLITSRIAELSQGNLSNVPQELFQKVDENSRDDLIFAYHELLDQLKNYVEFIYGKAQEAINHQNFQYNQNTWTFITSRITELSQSNRSNLPQELFQDVDENSREPLVFAYTDLLIQYKNHMEKHQHIVAQRLEAQLETQRSEAQHLAAHIERQRSETQHLAAHIERQRSETQHLAAQIERQRSETQHLAAQIERQHLETQHFATQIETQRLEAQHFAAHIETQRLEAQDFATQIETQRLEAQDLETQIETQRSEAQHLAAHIETQRSEAQDLEAQQETQRLEHQRKRVINSKELKIEKILGGLAQKIGSINQHSFSEAQHTAERLLAALENAKNDYLINLDKGGIDGASANQDFAQVCKLLIDEARPVLERDLNWGTYLTNLLRTLANVMIQLITVGQVNNFFKQQPADSIRAIAEAEQNLNIIVSVDM